MNPPAVCTYLVALSIRDFAIIEHLQVDWRPGFTVLTGETGAGKSIIIDALGAALGDRTESVWLRHGAERAIIEAVFVNPARPGELHAVLEVLGCVEDDDTLVLSRDVMPGRSISRL